LSGCSVDVCDENGTVVGRGFLGEGPWPGTEALYWGEVELEAPAQEGLSEWSVKFAGTELEWPHEDACCRFSFLCVRPPEHTLTIEVVEQDTGLAIGDALVRLSSYRAITDSAGVARILMPKGAYDLVVWKAGYDAPAVVLDLKQDLVFQVRLRMLPEENPDALWTA